MLDEVVKDLKKKAQKMMIFTTVASSMRQKTTSNYQKVKDLEKDELASVKKSMQSISDNVGDSVKGKFGKRVKETFVKQSEKFEEF